MHVALIYTEHDPWALGMRTISAALKKAGHQTRLIFMRSDQQFCSRRELDQVKTLANNSDVIGLSCLSRGSDKAAEVIQHLQPLGKPIIWGGLHATLNPEHCAEVADIVCRGEGEEMVLDLLERLENGKEWRDIPNIAFRHNGTLAANELRPLASNLDRLPVPDFTCEDEFHQIGRIFTRVRGISDIAEAGEIIINGSRGCALRCSYCCNAKLKDTSANPAGYLRKMSIRRYVECAKTVRERFLGSKYFYLIDEDFCARTVDELREFSDLFPKQVGLPFECLASPLRITEEKMASLVKAGLWRIRMGVESGSERTKTEVYNRHIPNDVVRRAAQIISKYPHVIPCYFLIIGNPYELREDIVETARFMLSLPHGYFLHVFNLVFFPGSLLYERALRDNLIRGRQDSGYELDFRGGLRHRGHRWKRKNLYMNGLLYLMEGKTTRHRLGMVPRFMFKTLLRPGVIDFNERNPSLIEFVICLKSLGLKIRACAALLLKKILSDPTAIYNLRAVLRSRLKAALGTRHHPSAVS